MQFDRILSVMPEDLYLPDLPENCCFWPDMRLYFFLSLPHAKKAQELVGGIAEEYFDLGLV